MTKDDMDLLKGFPLSIEQKEILLNLIKNNDSKKSNVLYVNVGTIDGFNGIFTINGKEYRFHIDSDYMYTKSRELYNYCIANNIEQVVMQTEYSNGGTLVKSRTILINYMIEVDIKITFGMSSDFQNSFWIENDEWE